MIGHGLGVWIGNPETGSTLCLGDYTIKNEETIFSLTLI